jgi:predicted pyridoxine 5'-phosphate oxidase superfamily flavin-nucleotide-binding protein
MAHKFAALAFTPAVKAQQELNGSRQAYARMELGQDHHDRLGPQEAGFIAARDSFYMATVGSTGWPYIQHRGGPAGFVRVLDDATLAFADYGGNRQYVTVGNLQENDRVAMFFMDYPNRTRLKLLGRARLSEGADPALVEKLQLPSYRARIERVMTVHVEGFDWNCPQHITPRFTEEQVMAAIHPLQERIAELEARVAGSDGQTSMPERR